MVNVNVNIKDSLEVLQQFKYCQHNIIHVAEARRLVSIAESMQSKTHVYFPRVSLTNFLAWCQPPYQLMAMSVSPFKMASAATRLAPAIAHT